MTPSRWHAEWQRLFALAPATADTDTARATALLTDGQGRTRTLVLGLRLPAPWQALSSVWQAVQVDGGLPAPGIAVSGTDGHQLWFSLAEPVSLAEAHAFLDALRQRCLAHVPAACLSLWPTPDASAAPDAVPSRQGEAEQWSAFVAPDLAPMFAETPWLDMPPSPEGQAELLARLRSITPQAWHAAQAWLQPPQAASAAPASLEGTILPTEAPPCVLDPRAFLRQVMNDGAAPLALRIEAAKALLPHLPPGP